MRGFLARASRWAPPAVIVVFILIGLLWQGPDEVRAAVAVVAAAAAARLRPGGRWLVPTVAVVGAGTAVVCDGAASNIGWFAMVTLVGWTAAVASRPVLLGSWAAAVALFAVQWAIDTEADPGWGAWIAGASFAAVCFWLSRRQNELVDQLRAAQAGLAEAARVEERNRIAREVHDVVAHALTVSLLHVTSAKLALDEDPADAARALDEAERLGRDALTEVRQAVGLLRAPGTTSDATPLPGVDQLATLVDGFRTAGVPVTFTVDGTLERLPATTALAVYNILREALTNSVRYGTGGVTTARLSIADRLICLTVDNATADPAGRDGADPRLGTGLHSMRERAEALGGACTAGPHATGWRVHAEIPLRGMAGQQPDGGPTAVGRSASTPSSPPSSPAAPASPAGTDAMAVP